jgi:hypothetical protein
LSGFVIKDGRHSQFLFLGVQLLKTFSFETTSLTKKRKNLTKGIYMEGHLKDFLIFFFFSSNFNVVLCNIIILIGYMGQATTNQIGDVTHNFKSGQPKIILTPLVMVSSF